MRRSQTNFFYFVDAAYSTPGSCVYIRGIATTLKSAHLRLRSLYQSLVSAQRCTSQRSQKQHAARQRQPASSSSIRQPQPHVSATSLASAHERPESGGSAAKSPHAFHLCVRRAVAQENLRPSMLRSRQHIWTRARIAATSEAAGQPHDQRQRQCAQERCANPRVQTPRTRSPAIIIGRRYDELQHSARHNNDLLH